MRALMQMNSRIAVLGSKGMVGSAIVRGLRRCGCDPMEVSRNEVDLSCQASTDAWFRDYQPEFVFLAAAEVGGIVANMSRPADFIYQNLAIQTAVIEASRCVSVKKLVFLGSSCMYPRECPQPMREEYLGTGPLEPTNRAYATAKLAGMEMCRSYREQHGLNAITLVPTNLYGPGDNYDLESSHVLPALIRRFHEAKIQGDRSVKLWGTGAPRREFMHVDDMASAALFAMDNYDGAEPLNVGWGADLTIKEAAETMAEAVGFTGCIDWDSSRPDGMPRKLLDCSRLTALGWLASIPLVDGIESTYRAFLECCPCPSLIS